MKPAPLALIALALAVAVAWPITSAIGAATATEIARVGLRSVACAPDESATVPSDGEEDDGEALALPPGHPSIAGQLPPGHPPIPADALPPGHPPVGHALPQGHPPIPSGRAPGAPSAPELFGAPVLLTI